MPFNGQESEARLSQACPVRRLGSPPVHVGWPAHHAKSPDDVSVSDLWKMRVLLDAAVRAGTLQSRSRVGFWVTEFAWDTNPPDRASKEGCTRWVGGLYRMWNQGVSLVTWFMLRDQPFTPSTPFRAGLYFRGEDGVASDKQDGSEGVPLPIRRLPTAGGEIGHVLGAVSGGALGRDR